MTSYPEAVRWADDGRALDVLDQTRLPEAEVRLRLETAEQVAEAIRAMRVRGAPAIGIAAAMGLALELARHTGLALPEFRLKLEQTCGLLADTRPTAVNLFWALERMRRLAASLEDSSPGVVACRLHGEASAILQEDRAMCRRIGQHGLALLPPEGVVGVLTHCNAGALATGGMGTALAPVYLARAQGRALRVYAGETRPMLQGSRLTVWELQRAGVDVTLVADTVAGFLMQQGRVNLVLVGADRIAANGDVVNKIGTYQLAVLARHHGIPFYVAAPTSSVDCAVPEGRGIPIEERDPEEVRRGFGRLTAPADAQVYAPAFDLTPAELITAIVTDRGVLRPPYAAAIREALE
ncbi:MAG: S-methyl-5-thioribose-1-phosphate isomerase [Gemmatimonadetes bacterium]|nr:S-methyl-5-thioribose-1-phosphate isomerase [Gemmatimonadota bacterium]